MTKPDEVTVTAKEIAAFLADAGLSLAPDWSLNKMRQALAAFLAARVPDAMRLPNEDFDRGHNACRAAVLRGPQG